MAVKLNLPQVKALPTPEPIPSKNSLSALISAAKKEKGEKVIVKANAIPPVRRLPTGIFELDYYLGGGFPRGRYSIIYGPESSNKTNIAGKAVAYAQQNDPPHCNKAVWVNLEQTYDPYWMARMGIDNNALEVMNPGYGEEACDLIDALVRADDLSVLVVDSLACLIANKEIAQSMEKYDIGTSALLIKRLVNKLMIAFNEEARKEHYPTLIFTNHTRFKPGVMFGDPETMPGGEAVRFLSSLRIRTYATNVMEKDVNPDLPVKKKTKVVVKKTKVGVRSASFEFEFVVQPFGDIPIGSTDSFGMVSNFLKSMELLKKDGSKGYVVNHQIFKTLGAMEDKYNQDADFRTMLQALVLEHSEEANLIIEEPPSVKKESKPGIIVNQPTMEAEDEQQPVPEAN